MKTKLIATGVLCLCAAIARAENNPMEPIYFNIQDHTEKVLAYGKRPLTANDRQIQADLFDNCILSREIARAMYTIVELHHTVSDESERVGYNGVVKTYLKESSRMLKAVVGSVDGAIVYANSQGLRDEARQVRDDLSKLQRFFDKMATYEAAPVAEPQESPRF